MSRATLIRVLLAVALATASGVMRRKAKPRIHLVDLSFLTRTEDPRNSGNSNNNVWWIVGGVAAGLLGLAIGRQLLTNPGEPDRLTSPRLPPYEPPLVQLPADPLPRLRQGGGGPGTGGAGSGGPGTGSTTTRCAAPRLRSAATRRAPSCSTEVMLDIPASVPTPTLDAIAARHAMTRLETVTLRLTGRTLHRWRITGGGSVADMIRSLSLRERQHVAGAQAIFLFALAETGDTDERRAICAAEARPARGAPAGDRQSSRGRGDRFRGRCGASRSRRRRHGEFQRLGQGQAAHARHRHGGSHRGPAHRVGDRSAGRAADRQRVQHTSERARRHDVQHPQGARLGRRAAAPASST